MSANMPGSAARQQRVDDVVAAWLEAVDAGETPDPKQIIAEHHDIADELASFFDDCGRFDELAKPLLALTVAPNEQPPDVLSPVLSHHGEDGAGMGTNARCFGDYELLQEVARGGMGVVYRARQISLNRIVALKMILSGRLASPEDVQRFRAEAEAAANLDHPGIVPVYEVGEYDGQHYFSMGYVDGHSLAAGLREGPLPSHSAAMLLKQICEAVQFAHEHDVIHRDLKPANILLERSDASGKSESEAGTTPAWDAPIRSQQTFLETRPRITDFGLAKRLQSESDLTGTGQILGTPGYMSPEQAAGATQTVGPASDIYSLGAILYQLLTGRPPFQAETPLATLSQLLDSDPLPPRLLNRTVPRDLEAICMKCLEKEPERRYVTARDLRDELQRYLDGEAIHASGINLLDRLTRAVRQSRHEEHFRGWGLGLIAFGVVIFLAHVAMFVLERTWSDSWTTYLLPRGAMFAALLIMLWRFRHHSILPTKSAERLIWVVWVGYLLALGAVNAARQVLGYDHSQTYAFSAALAGFGFLIMGGHIWGGGYLVGLVFMIAAPVLAMHTDIASLAFGALWAGALSTFGLHYRRRGRTSSMETPPGRHQ